MIKQQQVVFVVDDDPSAASSVAALMASMGLGTETFESAEAFLDRVSNAGQDELQGSCLVLDIRLPGMSGTELHQELVSLGVSLPTILVSGHVDSMHAKLPVELPCLEKPYRGSTLTELVMQALGEC